MSLRAHTKNMFTSNTIAASSVAETLSLDLRVDFRFSYAAKIPNPLKARLVPCGSSRHLQEALRFPEVVGIVAPESLASSLPSGMGFIADANPLAKVIEIHEYLVSLKGFQWAEFPSRIDSNALIHPSAIIAPYDVIIGAGTIVSAKAVVLPRSVIGRDSVIGPGSIIGCDAFQVARLRGAQRIIRQSGGVTIGDGVEVQSNCTVSRAVFGGFTEIGDETLIDSQVHVGHDCRIGRRVLIANQASLAGRVVIEDDVYVAPNVTISNGLTLGSGCQVTIGSVVMRDVPANQKVTGFNAQPHDRWIMQSIRMQRLK